MMGQTVLLEHGARFLFLSPEGSRTHLHVSHRNGKAKSWLEPDIALAKNAPPSSFRLNKVQSIIEVRHDDLRSAWKDQFSG